MERNQYDPGVLPGFAPVFYVARPRVSLSSTPTPEVVTAMVPDRARTNWRRGWPFCTVSPEPIRLTIASGSSSNRMGRGTLFETVSAVPGVREGCRERSGRHG